MNHQAKYHTTNVEEEDDEVASACDVDEDSQVPRKPPAPEDSGCRVVVGRLSSFTLPKCVLVMYPSFMTNLDG